jgi:hypothetical protein
MLRSEQKPLTEILEALKGEEGIFILGCDGCAQASHTGGEPQVREMKGLLEGAGKKITGYTVIDFLCEKALVASRLRPQEAQVMEADALLVLTCGVGVQAVAQMVKRPVRAACNTISLGGARGEWQGTERCVECGNCLLNYTGGICPLTACSKGLRNGACGGASKGKCEVSPEKPCGWEQIYERLREIGRLDQLKTFIPPQPWNKQRPRPELLATSWWSIEQHGEPSPSKEGKR